MLDRTTLNAGNPQKDEYGFAVLERMNRSHYGLTRWGLSFTAPERAKSILDVGCGGGMTLHNFALETDALLCGADVSEASLEKTAELNAEYISSGRLKLFRSGAESLPFPEGSFDLVTAFETVYYWRDPVKCFAGVRSILREEGEFLICNEDRDYSRPVITEYAEALGMKLYTAEQLGVMLREAGFGDVREYTHENGLWVCAVGVK